MTEMPPLMSLAMGGIFSAVGLAIVFGIAGLFCAAVAAAMWAQGIRKLFRSED